jgi:hypothetical protein
MSGLPLVEGRVAAGLINPGQWQAGTRAGEEIYRFGSRWACRRHAPVAPDKPDKALAPEARAKITAVTLRVRRGTQATRLTFRPRGPKAATGARQRRDGRGPGRKA